MNNLYKILIAAMLILTGYNTYTLYTLKSEMLDSTIVINDKINSMAIDTNGQLQTLDDKVNKITSQDTTQVIRQEIRYVEKTSQDDADVELETNPAKVSVKVNGGEKYYLNTLPTETSKFEDGKLVINQAYSTHLDITANEYKKSKWSLITAMNSDKDVIGGINYELGHTVSATVLAGQGIKPYYGLTWRIGGQKKKKRYYNC